LAVLLVPSVPLLTQQSANYLNRNYGRFSALTGIGAMEDETMDKEHLKGAADKAKGAIKDAAGKAAGDRKLEAEGKFDKAKGAAHEAVGDVKDAARKA
jgi:uncharacterized protein YjbJ (UPF0337 family)